MEILLMAVLEQFGVMAHPQRSIAQMIIDFNGGKSAVIGMVQNVFQKNYQVIKTNILEFILRFTLKIIFLFTIQEMLQYSLPLQQL